ERFAFTDSLTLPLSAREIGQFSFASSAARTNFAASAPGMSPLTSSSLETTVQLSPTLSKVTFERTSRRFGGVPARPRPAERAIAKHDACAAARSSSGLDFPLGSAVRADHETGTSLNFPLEAPLTVPVPTIRSPLHTARASLVAAISHLPIGTGYGCGGSRVWRGGRQAAADLESAGLDVSARGVSSEVMTARRATASPCVTAMRSRTSATDSPRMW